MSTTTLLDRIVKFAKDHPNHILHLDNDNWYLYCLDTEEEFPVDRQLENPNAFLRQLLQDAGVRAEYI